MIKRLSLFINGLVCLSLIGCRPPSDYPRKFLIINKSDSSVYFAFSDANPDTSLKKVFPIPYYNGNLWQKLLPHQGKNEVTPDYNINPTSLIFIFDANTIETTPWDNIIKHYSILKRYQLTKSDMEKSNWTITYP